MISLAVIEGLDLKNATLVGHSPGGGKVARYGGRHGSKRVAAAVLVAAAVPDFPTLVLHKEGAQMVPVKDSAQKSAKLIIKGKKSIIREPRPDSRPRIRIESNADLLAFLKEVHKGSKAA